MAIVQTLRKSQFVDAFDELGRDDQFSREAREILYDYYEQVSDELGEAIEVDVIGICSEWSEYDDDSIVDAYDYVLTRDSRKSERLDIILDYLRENTTVLECQHNGRNHYLVRYF